MISKDKVAKVIESKKKLVEGATEIWNVRLETLAESGKLTEALDHMTSPVEWGDNCDCNGSCEDMIRGIDVIRRDIAQIAKR